MIDFDLSPTNPIVVVAALGIDHAYKSEISLWKHLTIFEMLSSSIINTNANPRSAAMERHPPQA